MSGSSYRTLYLVAPERVEIRHRALPRPESGELLIRVDAATTCGTDLKVFLRGGHPRMLQTPCPFGHEVAGTVAASSANANRWREGDRVVVANSAYCGTCDSCQSGRHNLCRDLRYLNGAFAEYLLVPEPFVERSTYAVPATVAPAVAAMAEPLACVLHGLSRCDPADTEEVAVIGAGPIGLMFVIELAHRGHRVLLGDLVEDRLAAGRALGAAETITLVGDDTDPERLTSATARGRGAGLVIEATGVPAAWSNAMKAVRVGGTVVLFGGCPPGTTVTCDSHLLHYSEITVMGVYHHRPATFADALERLADSSASYGRLISEEYALEGVEAALRRMAERAILKAVIRPNG